MACEHKNMRFDPEAGPTGESIEATRSESQSQMEVTFGNVCDAIKDASNRFFSRKDTALVWKGTQPTVDDLGGRAEEFFWVRGGNFNRPIMVRANNGVNSEIVDGKRLFRSEINFMFYAENHPGQIWASDLHKWPGLDSLEWAGPVARPVDEMGEVTPNSGYEQTPLAGGPLDYLVRRRRLMHTKQIRWFGSDVTLACDGRCTKAWGFSCRPKVEFDRTEPDDVAWLADDELGEAPADPGTYEGGHAKPAGPHDMNKWCARECERAMIFEAGEEMKLRDFSQRIYNQPWKHVPSNDN